MERVRLIEGFTHIDERGILTAANDFDAIAIRRFYIVTNHTVGYVRAWHGHAQESKFVFPLAGTALVQTVDIGIENMIGPSMDLLPHRWVLSARKPQVLIIPPGHVNGWMGLEPNTVLMFMSDATLDESKEDDYRFPAEWWSNWRIPWR